MNNSNKNSVPTFEELIALLERTSLPTVVVEGNNDIIIYREFERSMEIDILPVGGKNTALKLFKEKLKNPKLKNQIIFFILDKDIWVITGIPKEYENQLIIFTSGYSIENEVFIDYKCDSIARNNQIEEIKTQYERDLENFIYWYTIALNNTLNEKKDKNFTLDKHPCEILEKYEFFRNEINENEYPHEMSNKIKENFSKLIRGKSLLAIFTKNCKNHKTDGIFEAVAANPGKCINQIKKTLETKLHATSYKLQHLP